MENCIFTFYSPMDVEKTSTCIKQTVKALNGTIKQDKGDIITATWRTRRFITVLPPKFVFYIGTDMVRVVTASSSLSTAVINVEHRIIQTEIIWDEFIKKLIELYPDLNFDLIPGKAVLNAIKIMDNGVEQVMFSQTLYRPSIIGALLGGAMFGTPGAVVGGMRGNSYTNGKTVSQFSDRVLAIARYSNGLTVNGELMRNSPTYHMIMANMSTFKSEI